VGVLDTLRERGFVSQCSDEAGLARLLDGERTSFYIGFDPTGDSLHVGHLQQLMAMAHLQRAGHRPLALVGGGTARIGDPSGKSEMRKILPVETITANGECFRRQMSRFLDFSEGQALLLDNAEWLAPLNYIEFLRDIGRHFSVNRMLTFEAYKMRLETGLSFIEFNYQLLQSYDYLVLYRRHGCRLQMGGDDQWGNIVAGMDLIRRVDGGEAFALTSPLVTRSDGKKMGKTETGALFLDPRQTSPYDFHQYWVNVPDDDVERFLLRFTFLPAADIKARCAHRDQRINEAKRLLARELTTIVHGADEARRAEEAAQAAFGGGADLSNLPTLEVAASELAGSLTVIDAIVRSGLCATKSEARRLIEQGGATLNGKKVTAIDATLSRDDFSSGAAVLQAGKKKHRRVVLT
jgi:tyrosyl-tRNA synthetase